MSEVAVVRERFLPASETFIYSELVNLKNLSAIVCTKKIINSDRFPFKPIHVYKNKNHLCSILQKQKVKLIHVRFGTTAAQLLDVKKKLNLPMLTSFHGFDLPSNQRSFAKYKGKLKRLFEEGEAFTVTSNNMKKILLNYGCPKEKIVVHHSGIDVERFRFQQRTMPEDGKIILLSVGRLVEKKGMKYLIDAFCRVQKIYPNIRLRIAGDGPLRNKLMKQVKSLKLNDKVKFLGEVSHDQVVKEMLEAHVFVLASVTGKYGNQEGIPNVLKEAMATGLPVVSTSHAGIPELVRDKKSGYLVPERDSTALADRILHLADTPETWGKLGKTGRKTIKRSFNSENQIEELERIYDLVMQM
ncbi:glycosyltransferase [Effusibacillus consociatus]|uniref:Glycosyltransferase n=1 Tax=Effusibacillus consociatus TaxID=1117041 RepID=A0ABV9Q7K3_9BACL